MSLINEEIPPEIREILDSITKCKEESKPVPSELLDNLLELIKKQDKPLEYLSLYVVARGASL